MHAHRRLQAASSAPWRANHGRPGIGSEDGDGGGARREGRHISSALLSGGVDPAPRTVRGRQASSRGRRRRGRRPVLAAARAAAAVARAAGAAARAAAAVAPPKATAQRAPWERRPETRGRHHGRRHIKGRAGEGLQAEHPLSQRVSCARSRMRTATASCVGSPMLHFRRGHMVRPPGPLRSPPALRLGSRHLAPWRAVQVPS